MINAKVYFHNNSTDDIRRVSIPTTTTLLDLYPLLNTHHPWVNSTNAELKYQDEDNDWVQFSSQQEWNIALEQATLLKTPFRLSVTNKGQQATTTDSQKTLDDNLYNDVKTEQDQPQQQAQQPPNLNELFNQYAPLVQSFMQQRAQQNQQGSQPSQPQQEQAQQQQQAPNVNQLFSTYGPMIQSFLQNLGQNAPPQGSTGGSSNQPNTNNLPDLMRQFGVDPSSINTEQMGPMVQNLLGQWQQRAAQQQQEPSVDELYTKYNNELEQLGNMGFYEREKNAKLLAKYYGSIERVIQVLMDE
jgi:hypothetical protein